MAICFQTAGACAQQIQYSHGNPTALEQQMLELINRARRNPTKEGSILDTLDTDYSRDARLRKPSFFTNLRAEFASYPAVAPLAFRPELILSARAHSQDMIDRNFFGHVNPSGLDPTARAAARGYDSGVGENIDGGGAQTGGEVVESHFGFMVDYDNIALSHPLGHRLNVLDSSYTEVGVGVAGPRLGGKITQDFGDATRAYIVGVAYDDANGNGVYDAGEGLAGVSVRPDSGNWYAVTSSSGGFSIPIEPVETVTDEVNLPIPVEISAWSEVEPYEKAYRTQQMQSTPSLVVNLTWSGGRLPSPRMTIVSIKKPVLRNYRLLGTDGWYYSRSMVTTENVKADLKTADPGIPSRNAYTKTAAVTPALSFSERYAESMAPLQHPPQESPSAMPGFTEFSRANRYSTNLVTTVSIAGLNLAAIDRSTALSFSLGTLNVNTTLGADPNFVPGMNQVVIGLPDGAQVSASWTAKMLTVRYSRTGASGGFASDGSSVPTNSFPGIGLSDAIADGSARVVQLLTAKLAFGPASGERLVRTITDVDRRIVTAADPLSGCTSGELVSASAHGATDYQPPHLSVVYPDASQAVFSGLIETLLNCVDAIEIRAQVGDESAANPAISLAQVTDPATGALQPEWRGQLNLASGWNTIRFTAKDWSENVSTVTRKVFLAPYEGGYAGLLGDESSESRGKISFLVGRAKDYSGVLVVDGVRYSFRGTLDDLSGATIVFKRKTGGDIALKVGFTLNSGQNPFSGTVRIGDGVPIALSGARCIYDGQTVSAPYAGRINMLLRTEALADQAAVDPAAPEGDGFGFIKVTQSGRVLITTHLADGSPVTLSGRVDGEDSLAIFQPLNGRNKGYLHGRLVFASGNDPTSGMPLPACSGDLTWKRPARPGAQLFKGGFLTGLHADGAVYVPGFVRTVGGPLTLRAVTEGATPFGTAVDCTATVQFSGGGLAASLNIGILVRRPALVSIPVPGTGNLQLRFVNSNGHFNGTFFDTDAKVTRKFRGVVKGTSGAGFFLTESGSGRVGIGNVTP